MKQPQVILDYAHDSDQARDDLLRHINNLQNYFSELLAVEIMAYGKGLDLVLKANESILQATQDYAKPVRLLACHNSMQSRGVSKEDLVKAAIVVPSGLGHIVDRQLEGWAYLKA